MKRDATSSGESAEVGAALADSAGPYRIQVVAEMTSVPEPTLRAWERRYGIPTPERTASGYRLYGARDVEQLRKMRALCESGLSAREAAERVRAQALPHAKPRSSEDPYASARDALLAAVTAFDVDALDLALRRMLFLSDATTLLDRILAPVLVQVGDLWHAGKLSVAAEHLASQRISAFVRDLVQLAPGASSNRRVVLGSFADDPHEIGLLGIALRLSTWDLRPVFLGARTPPAAIRTAVQSTEPVLVALSVTLQLDRPRARELVSDYAEACGQVPWFVGGGGADAIADLVNDAGGHVSPKDPKELRLLVEAALRKRHSRKGKNA